MSRLDVRITVPQDLGATKRAQIAELIQYVFGGPSLSMALAKAGIDEVKVYPVPPPMTE